MTKRKIYARELFRKFDFYHLAKQFYRHVYRHPELEEDAEWKRIKTAAEDFLVEHRLVIDEETKSTEEDYREFLRFYTSLEIKYEEATEFVFEEQEKEFFLKVVSPVRRRPKFSLENATTKIPQ